MRVDGMGMSATELAPPPGLMGVGVPAVADQAAPAAATAESFEAFYRAQVDRVYRALAVTLGDLGLAREAADEAMARAYARWDRVAECDNPGGWVYRVGLNWATSFWRSTWRRPARRSPHRTRKRPPRSPRSAGCGCRSGRWWSAGC